MRLSVALLTATLLAGSLAGCTSGFGVPQTSSHSTDGSTQMRLTTGRSPTANVVPVELRSSGILAEIHAAARHDQADGVTRGIYAADLSTGHIYGYAGNDRSNGPPVCSLPPAEGSVWDVAVDRKGDVLATVEEQSSSRIDVFAGPGLCGPKLGSIAVPGQVRDAASRDARSGKIVVAVFKQPTGENGNVSVCTLSGGCTVLGIGNDFTGVALAPNGDCWATSFVAPNITYFAHCQGPGVAATGFQGYIGSGLDIDHNGNLVVMKENSHSGSEMSIYSGCNPKCMLVSGPFPLHCCALYGHLDARSKKFVTADGSALDVYSYSTSGVTYEYSISNGLGDPSNIYWGAAFSPPSQE